MAITQRVEAMKKLLRQRWATEVSAQHRIEKELTDALTELMDMGYAEAVSAYSFQLANLKDQDKVREILTQIRLFVFMELTRAVQWNNNAVAKHYGTPVAFNVEEYVNRPLGEKTAKQRISIYTNRLKYEYESWIALGLALSLSKKQLVDIYTKWRNKPFSNPLFANAPKSMAATRIANHGVSYGTGQYISAEASIIRLVRYGIADAFRNAELTAWAGTNPIGYYVFRGSSYPCNICDDMRGFHSDNIDLPPYHPNCCCGVVPVYSTDNLSGIL